MNFLDEVWNYIVVAAPFLLLGLVVSGFIRSFVTMETIMRLFGRESRWASVKAALIGVPLPLCSCSVIPAAVTLKRSGASNAATSAFLISTPESGIDSIAATYALMDLPMTILRPIAAFISALTAAFFQSVFNEPETRLTHETKEAGCCHDCSHDEAPAQGIITKISNGFRYAFGNLIDDMSFWMAIGLILGAAITYFLPENFFESYSYWGQKFTVMLVSLPLYICASASTPVAASLMMKGMSPGTALIFLLLGPATNITNLAVLHRYIGRKGILINVLTLVFATLIISLIVDWAYAYFSLGSSLRVAKHIHHEEGTGLFSQLSAIFFSILIIKGIYFNKIHSFFKAKK